MNEDNELKVGISVESTTDQGFATEEGRLDAFIASVDRMSSMFVAGNDRVVASLDKIGTKLDETKAHVEKIHKPVSDLEEGFNRLGAKVERAFSVGSLIEDVGGKLLGVIGIVAVAEKGFELMGEAAREAFDFIKEGILFSDRVRDIHLSFDTITGSTEKATKALDFFDQAQHRVGSGMRSTALELEEAFRKMEPLATGRGFSQQSTEQMTVWLSQLATVRGETLDSMEGGLQRILAGRVTPGRNPILAALGINKEDIKNMGWDEFIGKIQEAASHAEKFGDSFASTMHKAKDDLLNAFADGFIGARESAEQGMAAINAIVADPAIKAALHDLGAASAEWVGILAGVALKFSDILTEVKKISENPWVAAGLRAATFVAGGVAPVEAAAAYGATHGFVAAGRAGLSQAQEAARERAIKDQIRAGYNAMIESGVTSPLAAAKDVKPGISESLAQQIGKALADPAMTPARVIEFYKDLKSAAEGSALSVQKVWDAEAAALKSPALAGTPHGPLVTADKSKQEAKNAMEDYIHSLEDGLRLEEQYLANQQKIANAILGRSALEKTLTDLDFGYQKEVLGLTEKQEAAQARLDQARAFGTAADRERYGKLIEATKAEIVEATRTHDMLKSLAADDFFRKMDDATAKQALQDQLALDRASKVLSPHQEAMQAIDITSQERILKIEEQLRDAYTASAYAFSKGSVEDAAAANVLILKLTESWSAAKTFHDQLSQITEDEFWKKFAEENRIALTDAETRITDFADKWERALSAMSPALADQARAQIAIVRDQVELSMAAIEQFMLIATAPIEFGGLGLAADDPEVLRLRTELRKRVNEQAGIGLGDTKLVIDETNKVQIDAARKALDVWQNNLGGIFSSAAEGGAKGFLAAMAGDFRNLVGQGGKDLAALLGRELFGAAPGDPSRRAFGSGGQDLGLQQQGQFYDAQGHLITSTGAKYGSAALQFAEVGIGAYQAGQQPGGRTTSALSGAAAGAAIGTEISPGWGTVIGAVAGLVVGEIGAWAGSQAAKADWKYFAPQFLPPGPTHAGQIGFSGDGANAITIQGAQNMSDAAVKQALAQIVSKFDSVKDSMIDLTIKLGQAVPAFDMTKLTGIASRPAAGFLQDFQDWLANTLPKEIENQYTDVVATGFEHLGLSSQKFKDIWAQLDKIDPTKTISLLNQLADAMNSIDQSMAAFTTANQMTGVGSDIFSLITGQLGLDKTQSYAQRIQGTARQSTSSGIGFQEATGDYAILDFAAGIHNKSIEGQITDEGKLATMMKSRYDAEKAAITEIYNLSVSAKAEWESLNKQLTLQGMTKVENGQIVPDNEAQANFLKSQADTDLTRIQTAHNATEANQAWQDFKNDVLGAGNAAIAKANLLTDPNARKAEIDKVLAWEKTSLGIGQTDLQANLTKMGDDINTLNDLFTEKLIPSLKDLGIAIDKNTGAITSPTNPLSPTNPGTSLPDPHTPKEPDPGFAPLTGVVRDGNIAIVGGLGDIASLIQDLISAVDEGFGKSGKHSGADSSQMLAAQIVMGRVA